MKILMTSLGCDKNLADSEKMTGLLMSEGFEITDDELEAEAAIVNTCCFIHDAKKESIDCILELIELKKTAKLKYIVLTGCLAERYSNDIIKELPEVDAILGASAYDELANVLHKLENNEVSTFVMLKNKDYTPVIKADRVTSYYVHYSYLKIAEGCDKHCTYCVISSIKGRYRSIEMESLVAEAELLAKNGTNELIIVAQETSLYGTDLYGKKCLPELVRRLCKIDGIDWIRLMYCYPEEIDDELIDVIANEDKVCKYLDIPIQHISDNILKRMGRKTNKRSICALIKKLKKRIPGIAIRTSLITGFPGETEEDVEALDNFLKEYMLDRVGVFTYSKEEGTPAATMDNQIPAKVKKERKKRLMLTQQKCSRMKNESLIGTEVDVIIDGYYPEENVYIGRTYKDAPSVDGTVFVRSERELISGNIVRVKIMTAKEYDLTGEEI